MGHTLCILLQHQKLLARYHENTRARCLKIKIARKILLQKYARATKNASGKILYCLQQTMRQFTIIIID